MFKVYIIEFLCCIEVCLKVILFFSICILYISDKIRNIFIVMVRNINIGKVSEIF